ncbi:FeThRed_A domain-containing protein, partial [Haematococcus lacustris]
MDLDKRFQSLYEQLDNQVGAVRGDLDRLARDKVDASALEAYTTRVSGLFEQVAASLGDDVRDVSNSSQAAVQGVRRDVAALAADKADRALEGSVALLDDKVRALGGQLGALATAVSEQAAAQPAAFEEVRAGVRGVSGELEVANRAISGLNSALSSSSTALELQAHKLLQLGHRLQSSLSDVSALKEALYGSPAAGAAQGTVGLPEA